MNFTQLFQNLKFNVDELSKLEALTGGLIITAFSMLIVFLVLVLIAFVISLTNKVLKSFVKENQVGNEISMESVEEISLADNLQLVSVITAAIMASSQNKNIIVRRIVKTNNTHTNWERLVNTSVNRGE